LAPKGVEVRAKLALVRNSVGENCYVADEIITARSGIRVRVGNTDAEGRMAMGDLLTQVRKIQK
jgi:leucyl aminopeptidase